MLIATL
jgi:AP-4 complex subunit epsilon-1